jgi:hypothetical protein
MPERFTLRHLCLFLVFFIYVITGKAQDSTLRYDATLIASASSGKTPFWAYANQSGAVPTSGKFVLGKWGISKSYNIYNPRLLQWSAGAELITSYSDKENLFFTDLFITGKIGPVELLVGQKKNINGLVDSTLSSGSLSVSGNSRPFPRIQLSIPDFYPLYFTGDYVSVKASYSDGALGNSRLSYGDTKYEPFTYFHQKSFYLRLGFPDQRFNIYTGFNHQVIWGGENRIWPADNLTKADAYWHAVTGKAVYFKKIGLHFGTVDLAAEWKGVNWSFFAYRQNIYETGSLYKVINFSDGLNGLSIKRSNPLSADATYFALQSFVLEVIGTKSQLNKTPPFGLSIYENGDYYNSFLYQNGWSYRNFGIGTPLISQQNETDKQLPVNKSQFSNNNRIWAVHAGASATWLGATIIFKGTYSFNYGTYLTPFDNTKRQLSVYLSAEKKMSFWKGTSVIAGLSSDYGQLYPNTTAIQLGIRKNGFMN